MIYAMKDDGLISTATTGGVIKRGCNVYLSGEAQVALGLAGETLISHPAWMAAMSNSTLVEFLCSYWLSQGKLAITDFRARTRPRGRPATHFAIDNLRPSHVRKAAGLTKDDATLGPKLDGG